MAVTCRLQVSRTIVAVAMLYTPWVMAFAQDEVAFERPPVAPWIPTQRRLAGSGERCQSHIDRGAYRSIQVNVDKKGCNIVGDAANEPSIAVSVTDPRKIVIGWRQFNSVSSDFREAGWAYSHDGGHTWVFRGSLDPGVFGSDPVLAAGPDGEINYLTINEKTRLFKSFDGGITWPQRALVEAELLDKPWMAIDTTNGIGRGNIYIVCNCLRALWRSTDGGTSWTNFELPGGSGSRIGTIHVGPTGILYLVLASNPIGAGAWFSMSVDAKDPTVQPHWVVVNPDYAIKQQPLLVNWCGAGSCVSSVNGDGLPGQPWVVEVKSNGESTNNVHVLVPFGFSATGTDPLDVIFVSSADGGITWDRPVVVNDDPPHCKALQWFAMMSVAPNGRIDVVWNDTRNYLEGPNANQSELYYASSNDGGSTWSTNVPVSPAFNTSIGMPAGQNKIGDYYHMVSDNLGVNVAYAATFNGEQDIYFLRIGPWDCNGNEIDDALDISEARSRDCNDNGVPDECEYRADADGDGLTNLTDFAAFFGDLTGPGGAPKGPCSQLSDIDHDGDVDLHDYYLFTHVFTAP